MGDIELTGKEIQNKSVKMEFGYTTEDMLILRKIITVQMKSLSSFILEKMEVVLATETKFFEECLLQEFLRSCEQQQRLTNSDYVAIKALNDYNKEYRNGSDTVTLKIIGGNISKDENEDSNLSFRESRDSENLESMLWSR